MSVSHALSPHGPIIAQYFGIWNDNGIDNWDQKFRGNTPFDKLNRIYVSFGKIIQDSNQFSVAIDDSAGGSEQRVIELVNRVKLINPTADIFISVGGDGDDSSFAGASKDVNFPHNVLQLLRKYGFNGCDIDWEEGVETDQLNSLTTGLYGELHSKGYKLTFDGFPTADAVYDLQVLQKTLDQINIMSYGESTDLKSCVETYEAQGFPSNQLIGGIDTENGYGGGVDSLGPSGSIVLKAQYAEEKGLKGMMAWRLDNDYIYEDTPNYPTYQGAEQLWVAMRD
jgi:GH18 family chitinase